MNIDEQANALLYRLLELAPGERQGALATACAATPALLAAVTTLLARIEALDELIASPFALFDRNAPAAAPRAGPALSRWRLLRAAGRDGPDALFMVERDHGATRQSGLLMIAPANAVDADTAGRFERARHTLSRLRHLDIAPLIDAGKTADGRPFLVMEMTEGVPLDQYCADHGLTFRQRAALFARICKALHYAHQLPLIHRHLAPSNIVILADGSPRLLGFGLSGGGATGALAPLFASPELLAGGTPGTGADLYALGAILYALLSGRAAAAVAPSVAVHESAARNLPPADGLYPDKLLRAGRTLTRRLQGDLDHIVMTATAADPADRYPSADALARHLQRYAEKLPLDGTAPRRFNLISMAIVGSVACVLLAGCGIVLWKAGEARLARQVERKHVESGRVLVRTMLFEVSDALEMGPASAREKLVDAALVYLRSFSDEDRLDPHVRREVAGAYQRISEITGRPEYLQESLRLKTSGGAAAATGGTTMQVQPLPGNDRETLELLSRRIAMAARAYLPGQPRSAQLDNPMVQYAHFQRELATLIEQHGDDAEVQKSFLPLLTQLVELRRASGDLAGARQTAVQLLTLLKIQIKAAPAELRWLTQLGLVQRVIGDIMVEQGMYDEGLAQLRTALATSEKSAAIDPQNEKMQRDVADVHRSLAGALMEMKDYVGVEQALALARGTYSRHARANPVDAALRAAWIEIDLARAHVQNLQLHDSAAAATLDQLQSLARSLGRNAIELELAARIDLLAAQIQPGGRPGKALAFIEAEHAVAVLVKYSDADPLNFNKLRQTALSWQTTGEIGLRAGETEAACHFLELAARRYQQFDATNRLNVNDRRQQDEVREQRKVCS